MTPAQRALRTLIQLVISGALTGVVDKLAGGLSVTTAGTVLAVWGVVVTFVHNWAEDVGYLPPVGKSS